MRADSAILLVTFTMSLWDGTAIPPAQTNLKRLGGPKPREIAGRPGTVCTEVSSDIHVCKAKAQNGQSSDLFFLVGGDVVATWPGRLAMFADQIHDVFLADLDADGRDELVVVDRLAVSNGIAATRDELFIMSAYGSPDRTVAIDPALGDGRVVRSAEGRVDRVESPADAPPEDTVYRVRLHTGDEAQVLLGYTGRVENPPRVAIDHFGLASNGRVLPQGVTPDAVVGDISGHRVRLSEYKDGDRLRRVLWIE
jgi:hypothetical protein